MPIVLDDKYTIHKKLGEGGFCKVYEARDSNGGVFAVKTWKEMNQKMFEDEKKACDMGHHPHLVKYIDAKLNAKLEDTESGKKDSVAFILMEYVEGGEFLQTLIDHSGFNEDICRYYFK
jgi:serine/threonine protein kinase